MFLFLLIFFDPLSNIIFQMSLAILEKKKKKKKKKPNF